MSKWFCTDCVPAKTEAQSNPCPACCGFTALDEELRGEIGAAVIAINRNPILDMARAMVPEFDANVTVLERVAAGESS